MAEKGKNELLKDNFTLAVCDILRQLDSIIDREADSVRLTITVNAYTDTQISVAYPTNKEDEDGLEDN